MPLSTARPAVGAPRARSRLPDPVRLVVLAAGRSGDGPRAHADHRGRVRGGDGDGAGHPRQLARLRRLGSGVPARQHVARPAHLPAPRRSPRHAPRHRSPGPDGDGGLARGLRRVARADAADGVRSLDPPLLRGGDRGLRHPPPARADQGFLVPVRAARRPGRPARAERPGAGASRTLGASRPAAHRRPVDARRARLPGRRVSVPEREPGRACRPAVRGHSWAGRGLAGLRRRPLPQPARLRRRSTPPSSSTSASQCSVSPPSSSSRRPGAS